MDMVGILLPIDCYFSQNTLTLFHFVKKKIIGHKGVTMKPINTHSSSKSVNHWHCHSGFIFYSPCLTPEQCDIVNITPQL